MAMVQHYPALNRTPTPICSICIANYNGASLLPDCLDSVLNQQGEHCIEIIVHDDASTDDSLALLRQRYPQVEVIASQQNVGFCISNNRMVAHARGKYILLLNNDAALYPDALSTLLEAAQKQIPGGILTLPQYDWISGVLVDRGCMLDPFCNPIPNLDPLQHHVAYVIGACMFLSRTVWNNLGGMPEWFGSIAEDMYLCGAARLRGIPVVALTVSGYRHRQGSTFGGNRAQHGLNTSMKRRRLSERNKTRTLIILTPGPLMWPLLCIHLLALILEGTVLSILQGNGNLLRAVYGPAASTPLREWPTLLSFRRDAQKTRTTSIASWFSVVRWQLRKLSLLRRYGIPTIR